MYFMFYLIYCILYDLLIAVWPAGAAGGVVGVEVGGALVPGRGCGLGRLPRLLSQGL